MSEYANVKKKKVKNFLKWLSKKPDVEVVCGGKHYRNIKYILWLEKKVSGTFNFKLGIKIFLACIILVLTSRQRRTGSSRYGAKLGI